MDLADLEWLAGEGAGVLERWTADAPEDPLEAVTLLRRDLGRERAALVLEQVGLRRRAARKFGPDASGMLFTAKLLEQASGPDVGAFKARRLASAGALSAADLCCGAGGDALALARAGLAVHLADRDPLALALASHNLGKAGFHEASRTETTLPELRDLVADVFHLDPDRRARGRPEEGEERWDNKGLSPGPDGIRQIASRFRGGAVKLPTGAPAGFLDIEGELQFLGVSDELREQVLWTGEMGISGRLSVAELRHGGWEEYAGTQADAQDAFGEEPAEEPCAWIHEPVKAMVRSHLFAAFGRDRGLLLLDGSTSWLTGAAADSRLLKSYRVLAHGPLRAGAEEALLREAARSCGAVKKRGVAVVPEKALRELRGLPGDPAILCYLRSRGRKWVVVAQAAGDGN
jgi:hypothetical protein